MTKPVSRKMAIQALLYRFITGPVADLYSETLGHHVYHPQCPVCLGLILPEHEIEFDHIHADIFDGPHEYENLRPLHKACHKRKTALDIKANAKIKRLAGKTKGRPKRKWAKGRKIKSRGFEKRKP